MGRGYYGSPTTSDKALMPFAALKMGPGDSARSHTADEFIYLEEIKEGIETYIQLLDHFTILNTTRQRLNKRVQYRQVIVYSMGSNHIGLICQHGNTTNHASQAVAISYGKKKLPQLQRG